MTFLTTGLWLRQVGATGKSIGIAVGILLISSFAALLFFEASVLHVIYTIQSFAGRV
jgi:hypothetical protein